MRILHVFRSPVGGLFRHVCDLARGQHELGHDVGIICDSSEGGAFAQRMLAVVEPHCRLGIYRAAISRQPGIGDLAGARFAFSVARRVRADVIHCHGAKGGLYGRVAAYRLGIPSTYTPHNGSLAYNWSSPSGMAYLSAERLLRRLGSGLTFVCNYERDLFDKKIGIAGKPQLTAYNGIWPDEFIVPDMLPDATDFLALCEIRKVKGIDLLIRALALFPSATLTVVGDGPERKPCEDLARDLGLSARVRFPGPKTPAEALRLGRIMVLSSWTESFPYVVVEAGAARKALVATAVGGVPEVVPATLLCKPGSVDALADKMRAILNREPRTLSANETFFKTIHEKCNAEVMCRAIIDFYQRIGARTAA